MKAARRQELRTNDLSQQIDKLSDTFKQNSTTLSTIIVGAVVIVAAVYWYSNSKASAVDHGIAQLSFDPSKEDIKSFIDRCKDVAGQNVSPDVTRMAWFRIGSASLGEMMKPANSADETVKAPTMSRAELADAAKEAFDNVIETAGKDHNAKAAAIFALGVLSENAGDFGAARKHYEEVKGDNSLVDTPFIKQAEFRLAQIDTWAKPVTFAEPPILPPAPDPMSLSPTSPALTPTGTPKTMTISQPLDSTKLTPAPALPAEKPAEEAATPANPSPIPTPTSAPAP